MLQAVAVDDWKKASAGCVLKCASNLGDGYTEAGLCAERCYERLREDLFATLKTATAELRGGGGGGGALS